MNDMEKMQKSKRIDLKKDNCLKENARNNSNSVSCDYCGIANTSRNNNKFDV